MDLDADGLLTVMPECNYSIPGVLKDAIDWAGTDWAGTDWAGVEGLPLLRKPVAIAGAAPTNLGSVRAQLALRPVFTWTDSDVVTKPELIAFRVHERLDQGGNLIDETTAVALLAQDGTLELGRRVADYWPEFAAAGKGEITLRDLLAHRAGLICVAGGFSTAELADDQLLAQRLAGQAPYWRPVSAYGYHAFVLGALTGRVVRRVTGRSIQDLVRGAAAHPVPAGLLPRPPGTDRPARTVQPAEHRLQPERDTAYRPGGVRQRPGRSGPGPHLVRERGQRPRARQAVRRRHRRGRRAARAAGGGGLTEFTRLHTPGVDMVTGERDHFLLGFEALGPLPEPGRRRFRPQRRRGRPVLRRPGSWYRLQLRPPPLHHRRRRRRRSGEPPPDRRGHAHGSRLTNQPEDATRDGADTTVEPGRQASPPAPVAPAMMIAATTGS